MISSRVVLPPTGYIEEPEHVFNVLKLDDEVHFLRIQELVIAATEYCEDYLGYKVCEQTLEGVCSSFYSDKIDLPYTSLLSVESVTYVDHQNQLQTLAPEYYSVLTHKQPGYIRLNSGYSWPATFLRDDAVKITYKAGMPAEQIPMRIKTALIMLVSDNFDNQSAQQVERLHANPAVDRLLGYLARPVI